MRITEDIFVHCQERLEDSAALLRGNEKTTAEDICLRRRAASIAGEATFVLLQKVFITPFDREDIWHFRQACEWVWETAQEIALTEKPFLQGCIVCEKLARVIEQVAHTNTICPIALFAIEQKLNFFPSSPLCRDFLHNAKQVVLWLQVMLLKSN